MRDTSSDGFFTRYRNDLKNLSSFVFWKALYAVTILVVLFFVVLSSAGFLYALARNNEIMIHFTAKTIVGLFANLILVFPLFCGFSAFLFFLFKRIFGIRKDPKVESNKVKTTEVFVEKSRVPENKKEEGKELNEKELGECWEL